MLEKKVFNFLTSVIPYVPCNRLTLRRLMSYIYIYIYDISSLKVNNLTLILLTRRKWWAPNNASKWQMGFNSGFKGLKYFNKPFTVIKNFFFFSNCVARNITVTGPTACTQKQDERSVLLPLYRKRSIKLKSHRTYLLTST